MIIKSVKFYIIDLFVTISEPRSFLAYSKVKGIETHAFNESNKVPYATIEHGTLFTGNKL